MEETKTCEICKMRDEVWTIREAAYHFLEEHPEELKVLEAAMLLDYAQHQGLVAKGVPHG